MLFHKRSGHVDDFLQFIIVIDYQFMVLGIEISGTNFHETSINFSNNKQIVLLASCFVTFFDLPEITPNNG